MSEIDKKWFVLRAIGGKEKKVKEYIESEIGAFKELITEKINLVGD